MSPITISSFMRLFLFLVLPFLYARKSRVAKLFTPLVLQSPHKVQQNPAELGLLNSTDLTADSILDHCQGTLPYPQRNFPNQLMGFVTPWNDKGYQVALDFKSKFSIIVPVWYTIRFYPFYYYIIVVYYCKQSSKNQSSPAHNRREKRPVDKTYACRSWHCSEDYPSRLL